jgi:choline dehydrogenase-like flavoprotein
MTIEAETVFVCGGTIQTPVLLRSSGIKRNVGNNLCIHPMLKVATLFDEIMDSHRSALPIYQVKEFWPDITLGGSVFTPGFLALTLSENWTKNQDALKDWRCMALYYIACRGSGRGTVRVFPFTQEAIVRYNLSKQDQMNLTIGLARLGEALFAGGARKLYPALRTPDTLNSVTECRALLEKPIPSSAMSLTTVHTFSTCPMGENKAICATNSFGKVHGFENLYIADASLIPDSPGVNPQGTIMALALRNARHFLKDE